MSHTHMAEIFNNFEFQFPSLRGPKRNETVEVEPEPEPETNIGKSSSIWIFLFLAVLSVPIGYMLWLKYQKETFRNRRSIEDCRSEDTCSGYFIGLLWSAEIVHHFL